jgi:VIT1/CCC1 family predicted Fe2+/Mn2+ transporter
VPLAPYVVPAITTNHFAISTALSLAVLFVIGAARARVGTGSWWTNGLEMLGLGIVVGGVAYFGGAAVAAVLENR